MIERALSGSKRYWGWIGILFGLSVIGTLTYLVQRFSGAESTGLSRDVSWGLFIANYTFFVGVAASAVMVVLPYYIHDYKEFGRIAVFGEFLAVAAIAIAGLFIFVDVGQPLRSLNLLLHPTPGSPLFWNTIILPVYMLLNLLIAWGALGAESKSISPPGWIKPLIYISIPWAISIHTVTAFVYAGLPGREFWNTAILAPRFLVSAFASGPALLIVVCILIKRLTGFDPGKKALGQLAVIVAYSMILNLFFIVLEFFSSFYSGIPAHTHTLQYLFFGLEGHETLVPWIWTSVTFAVVGTILLVVPGVRREESILAAACIIVFVSLWIDKGLSLVVAGFIPSPMATITEYVPSLFEVIITIGVWATGFLILSVLYKIALSVKEEVMR
jgi:molybdopterin-containing oxidoreductase family membrane subunit